jgi:hypothetical protein
MLCHVWHKLFEYSLSPGLGKKGTHRVWSSMVGILHENYVNRQIVPIKYNRNGSRGDIDEVAIDFGWSVWVHLRQQNQSER